MPIINLYYDFDCRKVDTLADEIKAQLFRTGSFTNLSKKKFQTLCEVIEKTKRSFKVLDLQLDLKNEQLKSLHSALTSKTNLTDFSLKLNSFSDIEVQPILKIIKSNPNLKSIILKKISLGDKGVSELANYIIDSKALDSLVLDNCQLTDSQMEILTNALQQNKSIIYLSLEQNDISNQGAVAIAKVIEADTPLEALYLRNNKIDAPGINAILDSLQNNHTLDYFNARNNPVDYRSVANKFVETIQYNGSLQIFEINASNEDQHVIYHHLSKAHRSSGIPKQ